MKEGRGAAAVAGGGGSGVNRNEYLMAELALTLLHVRLKREAVDVRAQKMREMLDPFVGVAQRLMLSTHDAVVVLALKIFALLLPMKLPAVAAELPWVIKNVFFLMQRGGTTSSLTLQACFKTLTVLLREASGRVALSQAQLKVLLSFARQDILDSGRQAVAFGLVRAIIARKFVCEEVYDLVEAIGEHMVTSQSEQTRALSAQTLVQFLLEFPLGDKRLHAHVSALLRNLDYAYETGRKVVLEVLARLVAKLPDDVLGAYVELVFLPLVTRLVNDDSATCRRMVGVLIKALLGRAERRQADGLVEIVVEWSAGGEVLLRRAAAQVIALFCEQLAAGTERYLAKLLPAVSTTLKLALSSANGAGGGGAAGGEWESVYHALSACEKLHVACPHVVGNKEYKGHAAVLLGPRVLAHWHPWVQLAGARLFGRAMGLMDAEAAGGARLKKLLGACGGAFSVVRAMCAQVAKESFDEALSEQVLRNLIHLCTALHRDSSLVDDAEVLAAQGQDEDDQDGGSDDDIGDDDNDNDTGGGVGEEGGGRETGPGDHITGSAGAALTQEREGVADSRGGDGGGGEAEEPVRAVKWMFQRLSHIGRRNNGQ